jgi:hypothetical protein
VAPENGAETCAAHVTPAVCRPKEGDVKRLLYASLVTALFTTVVHAQPPPLWITGEAGTELHTVDTSTGIATFIGLTGHDGVVVLAFHPNGTLYTFTESITGDPAVPEQLAIFDQLTGEATTIGSPLPERTQMMPGAIGPDGTMFAAGITGSMASQLLVVDLETGQPTVIGPFGVDGMMDFAFDLDGTLFGATGTALYTINTVTGQATKVADLGGDIGTGWGRAGG